MTLDHNRYKSSQLGMPYGTACNRLRKAIIMDLLRRLGANVCFRCGGVIDDVEELSIEHKVPWLDSDPKLFWDLTNIAFSHLACNSVHRRSGGVKLRLSDGETQF